MNRYDKFIVCALKSFYSKDTAFVKSVILFSDDQNGFCHKFIIISLIIVSLISYLNKPHDRFRIDYFHNDNITPRYIGLLINTVTTTLIISGRILFDWNTNYTVAWQSMAWYKFGFVCNCMQCMHYSIHTLVLEPVSTKYNKRPTQNCYALTRWKKNWVPLNTYILFAVILTVLKPPYG